MDIKAKIEEIAGEMKKNPELLKNFGEKPVETIEKLIGVDLPDDTVNAIISGLKAKFSMDKLGGLGKLFGK